MSDSYDLVILGSGVSGLAAALAASELGLKCLVIEKANEIGGGTVDSYGLLWAGNTHLSRSIAQDSREDTLSYMRFVGGGETDEENLIAYVDESPVALKFYQNCGVPIKVVAKLADHYYGVAPGALPEGRCLEVELMSGFELGVWQHRVRTPSLDIWQVTAEEQIHWGGENKRGLWDRTLLDRRKEQDFRGKGYGLISHLLRCLIQRNVPVITGVDTARLMVVDGRVTGVETIEGTKILARKGVLLGTGGYESNSTLVDRFEKLPDWLSISPQSLTGDGLVLGCEAGAAVGLIRNNMLTFLSLHVVDGDGKARFHAAYLSDLSSPHTIVVNQAGRRFGDETSFQGLVSKLREFDYLTHSYANLPSYLIFDRQYAENFSVAGFPIGIIPEGFDQGASVGELGKMLGIVPEGLERTVDTYNRSVRRGRDPEFARGEMAFSLAESTPQEGINRTLGSIEVPPFYGVKLQPSGYSSVGLATNRHGQVLHVRGAPIEGLYATGNCIAHTEFGAGYQAGYTLMSSLTFGYLAASHMALRERSD